MSDEKPKLPSTVTLPPETRRKLEDLAPITQRLLGDLEILKKLGFGTAEVEAKLNFAEEARKVLLEHFK